MDEFLHAVVSFPCVLFTAALMVVVGFWLLVLFGAADHDGFDADVDTGAVGLGGVPVSVSVSLLIVLAWFFGVAGSVLLASTDRPGALIRLLGVVLPFASLLGAWCLVRVLVRPLATFFPDETGPSRQDFVGSIRTVRTGRVDADPGKAEVAARDGSTAVPQVRRNDGARPES
ncbi:hypothetical protein ACE14D_12400 [Streptomyces sp. Act-28]